MKKLVLLVLLFLLVADTYSQLRTEMKNAKIKSDEILSKIFNPSSKRIKLRYLSTIARLESYTINYEIFYPDLNHLASLHVDINQHLQLKDSSFYYDIPDFILTNSKTDLITSDSALNIAKIKGLCLEDLLDIYLLRDYESKSFMWIINTDSSVEKAAAKKKYKGMTTIRATVPCRERIINAKTGEIITSLQ